jgi:hypothetical protein
MCTLVVIFGVVVALAVLGLAARAGHRSVLQALAMLKAVPHPSVDKEQKPAEANQARAVHLLEFSLEHQPARQLISDPKL